MSSIFCGGLVSFFSYSGDKSISGKLVDRDSVDIPLANHTVFLFDQNNKQLIGSVESSEDGKYSFNDISKGTYFVISHYIDDSKNGEMADNIIPKRDSIHDQIIE